MASKSGVFTTPQREAKERAATFNPDTPRDDPPMKVEIDVKTVKLRPAIGRAMNAEIFVCPVEKFMACYLPTYDKETAKAVIDILKEKGILKPSHTAPKDSAVDLNTTATEQSDTVAYSHIFASFHEPRKIKKIHDSSAAQLKAPPKTDEKTAFSPLARICDKIRSALRTIKGVKLNGYVIRMCPDTHLQSALKPCTHRIDAAATKNKKGTLHITDIVIPFEFKLTRAESEILMNRLQMASHVNHTMNEDPRRIFMYGITIENSNVSLWYFSRSHSMKSLSFDIIERPELFVEVMVSFFCATDAQLGYDPLVEHVGGRDYIYEFPANEDRPKPAHYLTLGPVFEYRSLCLTGRSTRVWKVRQVVSRTNYKTFVEGSKDMILKEIALCLGMPTEATIQKSLFEDIEAFGKSSWRDDPMIKDLSAGAITLLSDAFEGENYKKYFSCIVGDHAGDYNRSLLPQAWPASDTFPNAEPDDNGIYRRPMLNPHFNDMSEQTFPPTRQCRFLYSDVCIPLHDISTLGEAMDILKQTLPALVIMFCAGWVHRDISAGNILAFPTSEGTWQAKLSDLEYAKKLPHDCRTSSEPKTGSPFFMPCEIQAKVYLVDESLEDKVTFDFQPQPTPSKNLPIIFNYQHDLESIWWIKLWFISTRVKATGPTRTFGKDTFAHSGTRRQGKIRMQVLRDRIVSDQELVPELPSSLKAPSGFLAKLEVVRHNLVREYIKRTHNQGHADRGSYSWILNIFSLFFDNLMLSRDQWGSLELVTGNEASEEESTDDQEKQAVDELPQATINKSEEGEPSLEDKEKEDNKSNDTAVDVPVKTAKSKKRKATEVGGAESDEISKNETSGATDDNEAAGPGPSKKARSNAKRNPVPRAESGRVTRSMTRNSAGAAGPSTGV
ncbi:hypothetical protein CC2G_014325 [Coprinopsis cinerea AmutBmut pab1-1]|nr:hypothetical protein CC2G_014325 [Coprinopsis cinerea AmutBmut pab1-1]